MHINKAQYFAHVCKRICLHRLFSLPSRFIVSYFVQIEFSMRFNAVYSCFIAPNYYYCCLFFCLSFSFSLSLPLEFCFDRVFLFENIVGCMLLNVKCKQIEQTRNERILNEKTRTKVVYANFYSICCTEEEKTIKWLQKVQI